MKTKHYYGFRFYSGRHTTYQNTRAIAGNAVIFSNKKELDQWVSEEKLSAPCGLGGGERAQVTKAELKKLLAVSAPELEEIIKNELDS